MIGGAFNDSEATWRWSFYVNLCFAALAAPVWLFFIPSSMPRPGVKSLQKAKEIDVVGIILFIGVVASVILILGFGGTIWRYASPRMIGLYISFSITGIVFVSQQWFQIFTNNPIFPVYFFREKVFLILFLQTSIAISDIVVTIYMLPLLFQFVYGDSTLRSGLYVLAVAASGIVAAGGGGALFPRYTFYKVWFVVSLNIVPACSITKTEVYIDKMTGSECADHHWDYFTDNNIGRFI